MSAPTELEEMMNATRVNDRDLEFLIEILQKARETKDVVCLGFCMVTAPPGANALDCPELAVNAQVLIAHDADSIILSGLQSMKVHVINTLIDRGFLPQGSIPGPFAICPTSPILTPDQKPN
jgi:hypothetical protein